MLVVWEPILPTDWRAPSASTLGRVSDARAEQFWDPKHTVSQALAQVTESNPLEPGPSSAGGFYWDEAILYASHSKWPDPATPIVFRDPVDRAMPDLVKALGATAH